MPFRTKDIHETFRRMVDKFLEERPDEVVIAGDTYEDPHPSDPVREFFKSQLRRLAQAGINVRILVGNHDACFSSHALQPVTGVQWDNISVYYEPTVIPLDGIVFFIFPHSHAIETDETSFRASLLDFAKSSTPLVKKAKEAKQEIIFLGHFPTFGAKQSDFSRNENDSDIHPSDLALFSPDYVFLGDYHTHQVVDVSPSCHAMYVGSIERLRFDDLETPKGFVLYDSKNDTIHELGKARFIDMKPPRQFIDFQGGTDQIIEAIRASTFPVKDAVVRVYFRGTTSEFRDFGQRKREIRELLKDSKFIVYERKIKDPEQDKQVESIQKEIAESDHLEESDVVDLVLKSIESKLDAQTADEDKKAFVSLTKEIITKVKSLKTATGTVSLGRIRLHGTKMHNFQRYGETDNVVEFDKGSSDFLGIFDKNGRIKGTDKKGIYERAKTFLSAIDPNTKRVISIVGKTDDNEKESNGAGKSTILEAISYVFFEKLVREFVGKDRLDGKSTTSIIPDMEGDFRAECYGEVLFSSENELWIARRGRKCTKSGNSTPILSLVCLSSDQEGREGSFADHRKRGTDELLAQLIGWDYETFTNSVMFGQNDAGRFIRGTDKVKKEIVIKILGLLILDDYLAETRERKKTLTSAMEALDAQVRALSESVLDANGIAQAKSSIEDQTKLMAETDAKSKNISVEIEAKSADPVFSSQDSLQKELDGVKALYVHKEQDGLERIKEVTERCDKAQKALQRAQGELENLKSDEKILSSKITILGDSIASFEEKKHTKVLQLVVQAKEAKPGRQKELADCQKSLDEMIEGKGRVNATIGLLDKEIAKFLAKMDLIDKGKTVTCPECENVVTSEHVGSKLEEKRKAKADVIKVLQATVVNIESQMVNKNELLKKLANIDEYLGKEASAVSAIQKNKSNQELLEDFKKQKEGFAKRYDDLNSRITSETDEMAKSKVAVSSITEETFKIVSPLRDKAVQIAMVLSDVARKIAAVKAEIDRLKSELSKVVSEKQSAVEQKTRLESKLAESEATKGKISGKQEELKSNQKTMDHLKVLEELFGLDGIRTQIIAKYVPLLNSFTTEFLDIVSKKMSATLNMDSDGKMDLVVTGSSSKRAELTSGGEFVRLRLAVDLALGMLALTRNENAPDFVCLDEVFAPVDEAGKQLMFDIIAKLQERFRMILVISHDTTIKDRIKNVIVVNKVGDVSKIVKQTFDTTT